MAEASQMAGAGRKCRALRARGLRVLPGGNTRTTVFVPPGSPYLREGRGCVVVDEDGHELLDLLGNYTALVHGYGHPAIHDAVTRQLVRGSSFGLPTRAEVALAERLTSRLPSLERVRFTCSGTEAVMMAIRAARAATGRRTVVRFGGCYHGTYDPTLPARLPGVVNVSGRDSIELPYNDTRAAERVLAARGEQVAAVLLDPMPNRAGMVPADGDFVRAVAAGARRAGAVLIVDEVITSRVRAEGLHASYGIRPDLVVLGKWIGGGLPIGAFGGTADVMDVFDPSRARRVEHGGTFAANPLSLVAGDAAVRLLTPAEIQRINELGDRLRRSLAGLGYGVAGQGSLLRVTHPELPPAELWWCLYGAGVLIGANGLACTSTAMDGSAVDRALEAFATVAATVEGARGRIRKRGKGAMRVRGGSA